MSLFGHKPTQTLKAHNESRWEDIAGQYEGLDPELTAVFAGIAGSSDYLARLLGQEAGWLKGVLSLEGEAAFQTVLSNLPPIGDANMGQALRQAKRRVALMTALGDLGGVFGLLR